MAELLRSLRSGYLVKVAAADAIEFLLAGASAIEVGTANFIDPAVTVKIVEGIEAYLHRHKMASVKELTGKLGT